MNYPLALKDDGFSKGQVSSFVVGIQIVLEDYYCRSRAQCHVQVEITPLFN